MSSVSTLSDELIDQLAEMYGEINPATTRRWTLRQLAAWATEKIGRRVERQAIERAIKPVRAERAQIAREVARERIARELPQQLDVLDTMITSLAADFTAAGTPAARRDALDAYQKGLALKLRYSGVGEAIELSGDLATDATVTVTDARSQLAAQLARAAAGAAPGGEGDASGEPVAGSGGGSPS